MNGGKPAARKGDPTEHGGELGDGPGSPNVLIGGKRAWRGKKEEEEEEKEEDEGEEDEGGDEPTDAPKGADAPEGGDAEGGGLGELVDQIQEQMDHVKAVLEVIAKARDLAKKDDGEEQPGAPPPPDDGTEKGIEFGRSIFELVKEFKQVFAPTEPDDHDCPVAGHGSGKTKPTQKHVLVNNLPLCREGDDVEEPGGGEDEIVEGCGSVLVGDDNAVIELAEKIGGLLDFIKTAKEALAPDPAPAPAPKEPGPSAPSP